MSKKKSKKRHYSKGGKNISGADSNRTSIQPSQGDVTPSVATMGGVQPNSEPRQLTTADQSWVYVRQDVRKIGIMVTGFVGLQLLLWYILGNSSLGPQIYSLVKLS